MTDSSAEFIFMALGGNTGTSVTRPSQEQIGMHGFCKYSVLNPRIPFLVAHGRAAFMLRLDWQVNLRKH